MTATGNAAAEPLLLRAFVNERAVSVPAGSTALDAVRACSEEDAAAVEAGTRRLTDSRGLPVAASVPVTGGAIFRSVPVRATDTLAGAAASDASSTT